MKKFLILLALVLFLSPRAIPAEDLLGVGDSIARGQYWDGDSYEESDGFYPSLVAALGGGLTYSNQGVGGQTASYVDTNIETWLTTYSPTSVYCNVGTNDACIWGVSLSAYLSSIGSVMTKCESASAEIIINQLLPRSDYISTVKLWNAALEDQCRVYGVKMAPSYQEMCSATPATDDNLAAAYASDTVHPNATGYTYLGTLMKNAAVPSQKRVWGAASYPAFSYVSWDWAVLGGTAAVSENADTGVLTLAQNDTADLTVECLPTGSKTINLDAIERSGTATLYYRTAATTNFARNAGTSWTEYTGAVTTTDQFFQVRVTNASATPAVVRYVAMSWTESAPVEESDPEPTFTGSYGISSVGGGTQ